MVRVPEAPGAPAVRGPRGLSLRLWEGVSSGVSVFEALETLVAAGDQPDVVVVQDLYTRGVTPSDLDYDNYGSHYFQTLQAWFVPPATGNYSFYVLCDDHVTVELSSTASPDNYTQIAECCCGALNDYFRKPEQISAPVWLEQGERYAFRANHREWGGSDFMRIGARLHDSPFQAPADLLYQSIRERQIISIATTVVREVQVITLQGFSSGNFRLVGLGGISDNVDILSTNTGHMANALKQAVGGCGSFSVSRAVELNSRVVYTATFNCPTTAPFQKVAVLNVDLELAPDSPISISVDRTQTASEPLSGTFRVRVGDEWTAPMPINTGSLESELEALGNITIVNAWRGGNTHDSVTWTVEFRDPQGNVPLMEVDPTFLSGNQLSVEVTTQQEGSLDTFFDPIPADFFEIMVNETQVNVVVNDIAAECDGSAAGQAGGKKKREKRKEKKREKQGEGGWGVERKKERKKKKKGEESRKSRP